MPVVASQHLTIEETADYLKVKPNTLANWRALGKGPSYVKPSPKLIRYPLAALEKFMRQNTVNTTQDDQD